MAVKIGSARSDERGKATGGKAGDQTGREVSTQNWYLHTKGWVVLRCKDPEKAKLIAKAMRAACANKNIGYDQGQRETLYEVAKKVDFDLSKVSTPCETDCSALVRVCLAYAGIKCPTFNTVTEVKTIMATKMFTQLTDVKYTRRSVYLREGDILVTKVKGHTVVVLNDGSAVSKDETGSFPKGTKVVIITSSSANLRLGDSTGYDAYTTAKKDEAYEYVATSITGWFAVYLTDRICWVSNKCSKLGTV